MLVTIDNFSSLLDCAERGPRETSSPLIRAENSLEQKHASRCEDNHIGDQYFDP